MPMESYPKLEPFLTALLSFTKALGRGYHELTSQDAEAGRGAGLLKEEGRAGREGALQS